MHYLCRERYRLNLEWEGINYHSDSVAVLSGARFSGPVLKNALQLEAPDFIDLDFTPQLLSLFDSYYIVRLSWDGVEYQSDGTISLTGARLVNEHRRTLHKLNQGDVVVINTEKHEEATHAFHLVYESQVVRGEGSPYDYRGVK